MKNNNRDKNAAKVLLIQREKGWSMIYAMKRMKLRFILYVLLLTIGVLFRISNGSLNTWFLLFSGLIIGTFIRDIGWLIRIKRNWLFSEKIIDWKKVNELAERN
ncbi:MAG: hypothetical protein GY702_06995 [Desulfobulbaceae bacterium]|nr:hypothetical protein [Desulfobulbaceae bacterium]